MHASLLILFRQKCLRGIAEARIAIRTTGAWVTRPRLLILMDVWLLHDVFMRGICISMVDNTHEYAPGQP